MIQFKQTERWFKFTTTRNHFTDKIQNYYTNDIALAFIVAVLDVISNKIYDIFPNGILKDTPQPTY